MQFEVQSYNIIMASISARVCWQQESPWAGYSWLLPGLPLFSRFMCA